MIFAIYEKSLCKELCELRFDEVHDYNNLYYVEVNDTKNGEDRTFTINKEYYSVVKKYVNFFPENEY